MAVKGGGRGAGLDGLAAPRTSGGYDLADRIRLRILSGELAVGDRLPPQDRFAAELGVARSVLREALGSLERAGYVRTLRGKHGGSFVQAPVADVRSWLLQQSGRLDEVRDAFEYRIAVEGGAAALAASRRDEEDLEGLRAAVADPGRAVASHEFRLADARFHAGVAAAARNGYLQDAVRHARAEVFLRTDRLLFDMDMDQMLAEHGAILDAIVAGDARAAQDRMVQHLEATLRTWQEILGTATGASREVH